GRGFVFPGLITAPGVYGRCAPDSRHKAAPTGPVFLLSKSLLRNPPLIFSPTAATINADN
ncbi:hypothetical protein, partial [Pseudomonas guariconensis]|uniref:hypothetical protein n=1 Tax=Pseudomonas guariconensis TaxID=1288410 RepID=UPI001E626DB0